MAKRKRAVKRKGMTEMDQLVRALVKHWGEVIQEIERPAKKGTK